MTTNYVNVANGIDQRISILKHCGLGFTTRVGDVGDNHHLLSPKGTPPPI